MPPSVVGFSSAPTDKNESNAKGLLEGDSREGDAVALVVGARLAIAPDNGMKMDKDGVLICLDRIQSDAKPNLS